MAEYCTNTDTEKQMEGQEMADEQNREGDGDRGMKECREGKMGEAITYEEWEQLIAEYCQEVEREIKGQTMTNLGDLGGDGDVGTDENEGVD